MVTFLSARRAERQPRHERTLPLMSWPAKNIIITPNKVDKCSELIAGVGHDASDHFWFGR